MRITETKLRSIVRNVLRESEFGGRREYSRRSEYSDSYEKKRARESRSEENIARARRELADYNARRELADLAARLRDQGTRESGFSAMVDFLKKRMERRAGTTDYQDKATEDLLKTTRELQKLEDERAAEKKSTEEKERARKERENVEKRMHQGIEKMGISLGMTKGEASELGREGGEGEGRTGGSPSSDPKRDPLKINWDEETKRLDKSYRDAMEKLNVSPQAKAGDGATKEEIESFQKELKNIGLMYPGDRGAGISAEKSEWSNTFQVTWKVNNTTDEFLEASWGIRDPDYGQVLLRVVKLARDSDWYAEMIWGTSDETMLRTPDENKSATGAIKLLYTYVRQNLKKYENRGDESKLTRALKRAAVLLGPANLAREPQTKTDPKKAAPSAELVKKVEEKVKSEEEARLKKDFGVEESEALEKRLDAILARARERGFSVKKEGALRRKHRRMLALLESLTSQVSARKNGSKRR